MHNDYTIFPLGDSALTIDFGNVINDEINNTVLALSKHFQKISFNEIVDVVPAYSSLTIHYNVLSIVKRTANKTTVYEIMTERVKEVVQQSGLSSTQPHKKIIKVPVCYAQKYAFDIQELAQQKNISINDVIQLHTAKKYKVYMLGFLPGFPYLGTVDERIAMPRRSHPRLNVSAGSVGIAGTQTGIYPLNSPGGWSIIGCTPLQIFSKENREPTLFNSGDEVEFYSISEDEFENHQKRNS